MLNELKKKFTDEKLHLAKDALCMCLNKISATETLTKPIIIIPVCGKTLNILERVIETIITKFEKLNPQAKLINLATDGDAFRRKLFNGFREPAEEGFFSHLRFFSTQFVFGKYGLNFDAKHMIKRIRGILISDQRNICLIKRSFCRQNIALMYPHLIPLLNPSDYQNVPYAVQLLQGLIESKSDSNLEISSHIQQEIECFNEVVKPLLNIFVNPTINLLDQLTQLAYCSHLLLFIYRKWRTRFITRDLYMDIQSTIQDAFICVELFNRYDHRSKVYLYQLGTDQVESLFGLVRTLSHNVNCDLLELQERLKIVFQMEAVYQDHPHWKRPSRISKSTDDHSSAASWCGKLDTCDINRQMIKIIWRGGYDKATEYLTKVGYTEKELTISNSSVNMLQPLDEAFDDEGDAINDLCLYLDNDDIEEVISDDIYSESETFSPTIDIEGVVVYKSQAISNVIYSASRLSKNRVQRVMGLKNDNFSIFENSNELDDDDVVVLTDVLVTLAYNLIHHCSFAIFFFNR